jgi:hypothetical protein
MRGALRPVIVAAVVASLGLGAGLTSCAFLLDTETLATGPGTDSTTDQSAVDGPVAADDGGPPGPAAEAGYTHLVYSSDNGWDIGFDGDSGSHDWYLAQFHGPATMLSTVAVSDSGVLTLGCMNCSASEIGSAAPGANQHAYQHGYFEATLRFDPTLGPYSDGYPVWWSLAQEALDGTDVLDAATNYDDYVGIDFMEALTAQGTGHAAFDAGAYWAAIHEFTGVYNMTCGNIGYCQTSSDPTMRVPPGTDWNMFHTYGCLWVPGAVTWYFDGQQERQVTWQNAGAFSIVDRESMALELGTGSDWPVEIQSVRVWQ